MKIIFCTICFLTSVYFSNAQFISSKSFGDTTTNFWTKMTETSDGGFLAFGYMVYNAYPQKMNGFVVKFNNSGDTLWSRLFIDTISNQYSIQLYASVETPDSAAYLLFGHSDSSGMIVRIDTAGQINAVKKYGSTPGSSINFEHASILQSDSIFISGRKYGSQPTSGLILKMDIEGNISWAKHDTNLVYGKVLQQIVDSDAIYIAGFADASNGFENPQVKKLDLQGNIIWTTVYDVVNGNHMCWWGNMDIAPDGNLMLTFMNGDYFMSWIYPWVAKVDTSGNSIWMRFFIWENGFANTYALDDGSLLMLQSGNYDGWSKVSILNAVGDPQVTYADTSTFFPGSLDLRRTYLKLNTGNRQVLFTDPFYLIDSISGASCNWFLHNTILPSGSNTLNFSHPSRQTIPAVLYSDTGSIAFGSGIPMKLICPAVTSVHEKYNEGLFSVMPNPAHESFIIRTTFTVDSRLEVFSISGIRIRTLKIISDNTFLDINDLPSGVYYLKFTSGQESTVKKLIVQ